MSIRGLALLMSVGLSIMLVAAGCGSNQTERQPQVVVTPRFVNNLSSLSSQPVKPLNNPSAAFAVTQADADQKEGRSIYLQAPGAKRYVGTDTNPGTVSLLNPKADQYAVFANDIGNHLFAELRKRELDPEVSRVKLPNDLRPVIITAILNKDGHLTELILEQHSGKTLVDNLFIKACKKAVWARNPPIGAISADGDYRIRIEGRLTTWASVGNGIWRYKTWIGVGLL